MVSGLQKALALGDRGEWPSPEGPSSGMGAPPRMLARLLSSSVSMMNGGTTC